MSKLSGFGTRPYRAIRQGLLKGEAPPPTWNAWKAQRVLATPLWADMKRIRRMYEEAKRLSDATGKLHTVGHQIPLHHPRVCGLHVHTNLEVELAATNFSKGNAWCEYHGELFDTPEQFKLF